MINRVPGSFRDPAGFMFTRDGVLYRQINHGYEADFHEFMNSGLYEELVAADLLIPHRVAQVPPAEPHLGSLVIQPDLIEFVSYPFEWSPGQLQDAALATLEIQRRSIERGMTLRDASAYNVQFRNGRPVFIDTLSFAPLEERATWAAYGQFCRHFLAPLALAKHVDVTLSRLSRVELDGTPLEAASRMLPHRTRLQWGLAVHLHAHARAQRKHADVTASPPRKPSMSRTALTGLIESLDRCVRRQRWQPPQSAWRDYYPQRESYTDRSLRAKQEVVAQALRSRPVRLVWDLGANTGEFSRIAAEVTGAHVVSMEMDASAVELNYRGEQGTGSGTVLPLWIDLANPTPAQGWAHRERHSLEQRGPADVVLALALVHHLSIGNNVPLGSLLEWLSRLCRTLVIEWVPKEDPMVQRLLATREDVFPEYNHASFETEAKEYFEVVAKHPIPGSVREIYVLEARR